MDEIANPFNYPPVHYRRYTKRNLVLLDLLRTRDKRADVPLDEQRTILADQPDEVDWDLTSLEPPRVDWIVEDGGYEAFGVFWPLPNRHLSLEEQGITQLYENVPDHRPALHKLLRTILHSYNDLLGALLVPPTHDPSVLALLEQHNQQPEWVQHVEWIRLNATNFIACVNELRPVQARATLELAMVNQVKSRKEAAAALHAKCDELEAQLAALQEQHLSTNPLPTTTTSFLVGAKPPASAGYASAPTATQLSSTLEESITDGSVLGGLPIASGAEFAAWYDEVEVPANLSG
ncbi:hypothetical protein DL93DRAFT_2088156 [Clavulina sp. PMI_390]|nr:hypothetical protein DL93DRAFT_2088156 [Clavulina sp. PMI_390]